MATRMRWDHAADRRRAADADAGEPPTPTPVIDAIESFYPTAPLRVTHYSSSD